MSDYELKEGQINVFRNNKTKEKQPDYWGKAKINGVEMRVSLWIVESQGGKKYLNGNISLPEIKEPGDPQSDDLPF